MSEESSGTGGLPPQRPALERREVLTKLLGVASATALVACNSEKVASTALAETTADVYWFDSYAGLRGQDGTSIGVAFVRGRAMVGDGGGGVFIWSSAAATDDDGIVLTVGATGHWTRLYDAFVDARWFGNNVAAALAAIGNASAVLVLEDACTVSTNLTVPATVALRFVGGARLAVSAGTVTINGSITAPISPIFEVSGTGAVAIGGLVDEVYPEWWTSATWTTSREKIQSAIDTGKTVILSGSYDLGSSSVTNFPLLTIAGKQHQKLVGRNRAQLVCTTTGAGAITPHMVHIEGSSFIEIDNVAFKDNGVDPGTYVTASSGAIGVYLTAGATDETKNIALRNLHFQQLMRAVAINTDFAQSRTSPRVHSLTVENVLSEAVNAAFTCFENGDHVTIRNFTTQQNVYDYNVSGVVFHDVDITSHGPLAGGGSCTIGRRNLDTKNIKVRMRVDNKGSEAPLVSLAHTQHTPSSSALIADVDLDIDLRNGILGRILEFRSDNGTQVETTTVNRWDNIRLRGVDVNQDSVITWTSVPVTKVGIELSPLTYHFARLDNRSSNITRNFQGCFLASGANRRTYFSQGRLSDNPVSIDLSQFASQSSVLDVTVWAYSGNSDAMTFRRDAIFAYIGQGYIIVRTRNNVFNNVRNADALVDYSTSGSNLVVSFPSYNGATDDGAAVVEIAMF